MEARWSVLGDDKDGPGGLNVRQGRLAGEHLDEGDAEGPDVCLAVVRAPLDHLGGHPVGRADERVSPQIGQHLAGDAKVADLDAALGGDQDVGGLYVAVDDSISVEVGEGLQDLPCDEDGLGLANGPGEVLGEFGAQL